jgi:hypothetical protein
MDHPCPLKILGSLCDLYIKNISFRPHRKFFAGLRGEDFQVPGKVTPVSHFWNSTYVDPGQKYKLPRINDAINGSGSIITVLYYFLNSHCETGN